MPSLLDRTALVLLLIGCVLMGARAWLHDHPQHDPWAPLNLADPPGWATDRKLAALRGDTATCRAFLARNGIDSVALLPAGAGACRREDRAVLAAPAAAGVTLVPRGPQAACAIDAALAWWLLHGVQPAAKATLGSRVVRIEHYGTGNCRRIGGGKSGGWSEHATANAIDVAGFVLADGRRVSVKGDWSRPSDKAAFLRMARDSACRSFATVLSPDYNAAHADHLHLDQANRPGGWSACR